MRGKNFYKGMAFQAFISGTLDFLGLITLSAGQQIIAALLFILFIVFFEDNL